MTKTHNKSKRQAWVYDIETLSNCFTVVFISIQTQEQKVFVIHKDRDDRKELFKFLHISKLNRDAQIGFNNLFFDGIVINFLFDNQRQLMMCSSSTAATLIYNKSQNVITGKEKIGYSTNYYIQQLDLYKLMHYDRRFVG